MSKVPLRFSQYRGSNSRDLRAISPDLQYNGKPFDYTWRFARTKLTNDLHLEKDQGELNGLFDALVPAGHIPKEIWRLDPPDFRVLLQSARTVHVEVVTAGTEGVIRQEETIPDLQRVLVEWSQTPEAQEALRGFSVGFVPNQTPSSKQEVAIAEEMKRYILRERLVESYAKIDDQSYPIMTACQTHICVMASESSLTIVSMPAGSFGQGEGVGAIVAAVNGKMSKDYSAFAPIWLVVSLDHVIAPTQSVFDWIKGSLKTLGQFEKIFFCNSNQVLAAEE